MFNFCLKNKKKWQLMLTKSGSCCYDQFSLLWLTLFISPPTTYLIEPYWHHLEPSKQIKFVNDTKLQQCLN